MTKRSLKSQAEIEQRLRDLERDEQVLTDGIRQARATTSPEMLSDYRAELWIARARGNELKWVLNQR